jgi:uncharacterized protein
VRNCPDFKPGQFLTFRLDVADPAAGGRKQIVRCYSLSDRPGLDHYRVSVKRVSPPGLSSGYLHDIAREGDVLAVRAPGGHFFLEPGSGPVVLVAGGIGITPMLSMLNAAVANGRAGESPHASYDDAPLPGRGRDIWLFYGVRNSAEHVMKEHLEALAAKHPNFRLHVCYSRPLPRDTKGADYHSEGHVDIALLRLTLPLGPYQFYVCGPRPMMESLVPALRAWGVAERNIHTEAFGPASLARPAPAEAGPARAPIRVTFSKSGKSLAWDESAECLLDFAEKNGVEVVSGCRAGSCGTCQTTIEEGEVAYLRAPDFDPDPGCCLLCVSRPARDLTLAA